MNICILVNNLEIGGSERKIVKVANFLNKSGVQVNIVALKCVGNSVLVSELDKDVNFYSFNFRKLLQFIIQNKFKNFFFLNGFPAMHIPVVKLFNPKSNLIYLNNTSIIPAGFSNLKLFLMRISSSISNSTVYGAQNQRDLWEKSYGFPSSKSKTLYNGVDLSGFVPTCSYFKNTIIMVGQVRKEKNYEEAFNVLNALNKKGVTFNLTIVGGGKSLDSLKNKAINLQLDKQVEFLGELDDVRPALAKASIFLLCSDSVETFSNAALEAMAAGKVVVLSDIGGAREMVRDKIDGFIYKSGDVVELANILLELQKEEVVKEYSAKARERVEEMFNSKKMMQSYFEMLV